MRDRLDVVFAGNKPQAYLRSDHHAGRDIRKQEGLLEYMAEKPMTMAARIAMPTLLVMLPSPSPPKREEYLPKAIQSLSPREAGMRASLLYGS